MNPRSPEIPASIFRPTSAYWLGGASWTLAVGGMALTVVEAGPRALIEAWPFYIVAFLGWWLFFYPTVRIDHAGIRVRNPVRTIEVPWSALSNIETKYTLTLVAGDRRVGVWAAPAGGAISSRRGGHESMPSRHDAAQGLRASELLTSPSGGVAHMIRREWQRLIETERLGEPAEVAVRVNILPLALAGILIVAVVLISVLD